MKITRIIRMVKNRIMQSTNPVGWARKIGVNFPGGGYTSMAERVGAQNLG